jgi:hypothetical protein
MRSRFEIRSNEAGVLLRLEGPAVSEAIERHLIPKPWLRKVGTRYPTQRTARTKTEILQATIHRQSGKLDVFETRVMFRNLEGNGQASPIWQSVDGSFSAPEPFLEFDAEVYKTANSATSATRRYSGELTSESAKKMRVKAEIKYINAEGDGRRPPNWKRGSGYIEIRDSSRAVVLQLSGDGVAESIERHLLPK